MWQVLFTVLCQVIFGACMYICGRAHQISAQAKRDAELIKRIHRQIEMEAVAKWN